MQADSQDADECVGVGVGASELDAAALGVQTEGKGSVCVI